MKYRRSHGECEIVCGNFRANFFYWCIDIGDDRHISNFSGYTRLGDDEYLKNLQYYTLRGYIHLRSRKKGHLYDFFLEKQHNFFLKTELLFILTCHKVFYEFFQKKIFITGVTIAIMPKHNFPNISRGEHDKKGTAYLKYTKRKKTVVCSFTLWVNEGFLISSKTFFFLLQKPKAQTFKNQTF